jgi:hypothetical protein
MQKDKPVPDDELGDAPSAFEFVNEEPSPDVTSPSLEPQLPHSQSFDRPAKSQAPEAHSPKSQPSEPDSSKPQPSDSDSPTAQPPEALSAKPKPVRADAGKP